MSKYVEFGKAVKDLKGHFDTVDSFTKAVELAAAGKNPFPPPAEIVAVFKRLDALAREFDQIAILGLSRPEETPVAPSEFYDPNTRPVAAAKLINNMTSVDTAVTEGRLLAKQIEFWQAQAETRFANIGKVMRVLEQVVDSPPWPIAGTKPHSEAFIYHSYFEQAQSHLSPVAKSARNALDRIELQLAGLEHHQTTQRVAVRALIRGVQTAAEDDDGLLPSSSDGVCTPPPGPVAVDVDGDKVPDQTRAAAADTFPADDGLLPSQADGASVPGYRAIEVASGTGGEIDRTQAVATDTYYVDQSLPPPEATRIPASPQSAGEQARSSWYDDAQDQERAPPQSTPALRYDAYPGEGPECRPEPDDLQPDFEEQEAGPEVPPDRGGSR